MSQCHDIYDPGTTPVGDEKLPVTESGAQCHDVYEAPALQAQGDEKLASAQPGHSA